MQERNDKALSVFSSSLYNGFVWDEAEPKNYWVNVYRKSSFDYVKPKTKETSMTANEKANAFSQEHLDKLAEIDKQKYKEEKWMADAKIEDFDKMLDSLPKAFQWNLTDEGYEYWFDVYSKLYRMRKHLRIYKVLARIS